MARDWKATLKKLTVGAIRNAVRGYKFSAAAARKKETLVEEALQLEGEWREALEAAVSNNNASVRSTSTGVRAGQEQVVDEEWKARLDCLTHEEIAEAVNSVGGHEFSYGARRAKGKLLEEASRLEGELRLALQSAVLEKEHIANMTVSSMKLYCFAIVNTKNRRRTRVFRRLIDLRGI